MERRSRSYVQLIKPGITLSNTLTGIAGFFLAASTVPLNVLVLVGVIFGVALIIASACVFNNVLDRKIDTRMKRTKKREVANGVINVYKALVFGSVLGVIGFVTIIILTNVLTFFLGVIAFFWYIVVYGYAKRKTVFSTIIGGVAGALPPVAGYTALTGRIDLAAIILFVILFLWQMPHFYAIAMFRRSDYSSAKLPIWSVTYGMKSTKKQILMFTITYALASGLLYVFGYTHIFYLILSVAVSAYWLHQAIAFYNKVDDEKWARNMFGASLVVLLSTCFLIAVGGYLP
ncbi:MAG: protoheme IX farnesyltransferase [Candidatus Microsaccharimonas sossegonensis]|uniref:Protoheme IX farnesyltransferase n=1 Tax=Candidatus Microsaccharimonas sossegonensis TaxID=2506948 RepID=A0A4Q0AII0_9BACT|nr:MAG: protoheme IX farnesyltransferase [Candidatus Microsaccharimonas sossegonensis]